MLPVLAPFSMANLLLTLGGFAGGMILWGIIANHSGVWDRMRFDPQPVRKLLLRQMTYAFFAMLGFWLIGGLLGSWGAFLGWMAIVAGIIFWGYLGALMLTAYQAMKINQ
jgi:hypothetical protein